MMANTDRQHIESILERSVVSILPSKEEFITAMQAGRSLTFYIGVDPTSNTLHLSHAKNYQLLEEFRLLGHEVIVLFGDFTARIGDPTERTTARSGLTSEEVQKNVENWTRQIRPLMDFSAKENPPRILFNSEWLSTLNFEQVLSLASNMTVQQMLERDMFERRMKEQRPIFLHEFFYPLMQGYDSVAMNVDVELCGTDQIFNALVGRSLQKIYNNKEKFVVAVNLMENPVTGEVMSKSRGNGVFLDAGPFDMYGSIMAQPDEMIEVILLNNTRLTKDEMADVLALGPRDAKMKTAFLITALFHGEKTAHEAEANFVKIFQEGGVPRDLKEIAVASGTPLLTALEGMNESKSEIRRLIGSGAVREVGGEKLLDPNTPVDRELTLKIGKKQFARITIT